MLAGRRIEESDVAARVDAERLKQLASVFLAEKVVA